MTNSLLAAIDLGQITGFTEGFTQAKPALAGPSAHFATILGNLIATLTFFAGLAFLIWFLIGALTWITAASDTQQLTKAKNQMSTAIIGLIVTILLLPITYILGQILGLDILNLETIIDAINPNSV